MKKAVFLPLLLAAAPVLAEQDNTGPYLGAKYGKFMIDVEEATDPTDGGFVLGYRFRHGMAVEFEHTQTTADVVVDHISVGEVELKTNAVYFAYRSEGNVYFKAKAGLLNEKVSGKASYGYCDYYDCYYYSENVEEKDDTGLSAGIGFGFNLGPVVQFEAEYTIIEQDVSFLSAGLNLRF